MASDSEPSPPSSPVCAAADGSDAYQHRVEAEELLAFLNVLLEAERAGTRVARESGADCKTAAERALLDEVFADEARWCGMLTAAVAALGGTPSAATGDFHPRAMAIGDLGERLRFLNRGQGWVAKRLGEMIPRVGDPGLREALIGMRENHLANIRRVDDLLASG
ncbi:MAG: DUF6306 domain-containing protein [Pseudomonadota bacterium]|jgi:hypothetical protein